MKARGVQDLKVGNEVLTEPKARAEALNNQFSSVFKREDIENIQDPGPNPIPFIGKLTITTVECESN